jgi:GMP synthase-like glutamine amidotransferase
MKRNIFVFQHVDCEGPGVFEACAGPSLRVFVPSRELPAEGDLLSAAGLIVLGGPMGVYEKEQHPWMVEELNRVRAAVRSGIPVLGICLGSQILAAALGASVYPQTHKEIGWDDIQLSEAATDDPLLGGMPTKLKVFHWHGDTFDLPGGAVHLASSPLCENQAFRFSDNAWGFQCHLEIDREDPVRWAQVYGEEVRHAAAPTVGSDLLGDTEKFWPALRKHAEQVAERFVGRCRDMAKK